MIRPAWMFINMKNKWTTEMSWLILPPSQMHSTDALDTVSLPFNSIHFLNIKWPKERSHETISGSCSTRSIVA